MPNWQKSKANKDKQKWELVQEYEHQRFEQRFELEELNQSHAIESGNVVVEEAKRQTKPDFLEKSHRLLVSKNNKKRSLLKTKFKLDTIQRSRQMLWKKEYKLRQNDNQK